MMEAKVATSAIQRCSNLPTGPRVFRDGTGGGIEIQIVATSMAAGEVRDAVARRLRAKTPPNGFFVAFDIAAMAVLRAPADAGRSTPADAGVISYDDVPLASHTSLALTTLRQDMTRGAAVIVETLPARIAALPASSAMLSPDAVALGVRSHGLLVSFFAGMEGSGWGQVRHGTP